MTRLSRRRMTWTRMALLCASLLGARTAASSAEPVGEPLDPGRIGEKGLQEAGNPHLRRGLLITGIEEDSEKAPVDMEKLHEEAVRRIEGPTIDERGLPVGDDPAASPQGGTTLPPKSHLPEYVGISAALLFLAAMAIHVLYRRWAAKRARKPGGSFEGN